MITVGYDPTTKTVNICWNGGDYDLVKVENAVERPLVSRVIVYVNSDSYDISSLYLLVYYIYAKCHNTWVSMKKNDKVEFESRIKVVER